METCRSGPFLPIFGLWATFAHDGFSHGEGRRAAEPSASRLEPSTGVLAGETRIGSLLTF